MFLEGEGGRRFFGNQLGFAKGKKGGLSTILVRSKVPKVASG